jgi:hypothetical protein
MEAASNEILSFIGKVVPTGKTWRWHLAIRFTMSGEKMIVDGEREFSTEAACRTDMEETVAEISRRYAAKMEVEIDHVVNPRTGEKKQLNNGELH